METYAAMRTAFAARDFTDRSRARRCLAPHSRQRALRAERRQPAGLACHRGTRRGEARGPRPADRTYLQALPGGGQRLARTRGTPSNRRRSTRRLSTQRQFRPDSSIRLIHAPVILLVTVDLSVVAAMDQHLSPHRRHTRRIDLSVRLEHPARGAERGTRRHADDVRRRQGAGSESAVWHSRPPRSGRHVAHRQTGQAAYPAEAQPGAGVRYCGRVRRRRLRRVYVGMSGSRTRLPAPSHPMMQGSPTD